MQISAILEKKECNIFWGFHFGKDNKLSYFNRYQVFGKIFDYLKQTGMISPSAKQYFSTNSGVILEV